jgi:hypothetical protein
VIIGLISYFVMAPSITEPALAFKRADGTNKWWTEEEEKILVNRLLRDDPTKGDMNNRTAVSARGMWEALTTYDLWPIFIVSSISVSISHWKQLLSLGLFSWESLSGFRSNPLRTICR